MTKIAKTEIKIYEFDELEKNVRDKIINFDFYHMFDPIEMGKVIINDKALKNSLDHILLNRRKLKYMANGKIFRIK